MHVRNVIIGIVVVVAVAMLLLFWGRERLFGDKRDVAPAGPLGEQATDAQGPGEEIAEPPPAAGETPSVRRAELEQRWTDALGRPPMWPGDLSRPASCEDAEQTLTAVCTTIDARTPATVLARSGGACAMLKQVSRELASRPPDISSELKSHSAMLANVFHAFRVLGSKRLGLLRDTLEGQRELAEPLAFALYRWLASRETCAPSGSNPVRFPALYDYAGFFFNTLGGQAYLRRRTPRVESLVCFYALQVVDQALQRGHNPQGLDPRPEIRRCLALVDSQELVFSERYVATLEEMARRWEPSG